MAQHDYVIANGTGAAVRSDLNNALAAIVTQNSGATAPATTYAYQWWADTTTGLLKIRNAANNAWVTIGSLSTAGFGLLAAGDTLTAALGSASTPGITFTGDLNTGIYSPGADQVAISTNGTGRLFVSSGGQICVGTSTVGSSGNANITIAGANNSGIQFGRTNATAGGGLLTSASGPGIAFHYYTGAVGSETYTEAMRLDSSGRLGIGSTAPNEAVTIATSSAASYIQICDSSTGTTSGDGLFIGSFNGAAEIKTKENNVLQFGTNNTERARIDSSGRLLVGTSTARGNLYNAGVSAQYQSENAGSTAIEYLATRVSNDTFGGTIALVKARGTTVGSNTIVQSGDQVGVVSFQGSDGSEFVEAAKIEAVVDAATGANDMPGRLVFSTTPDSGSSPVERLRIGSDGFTTFGTGGQSILWNQTAAKGVSIGGNSLQICRSSDTLMLLNRTDTNGDIINFYRSATYVGSISVTTTSTAYNTSSDYRLKENVTAVADGITRLQQLKPSRFNFIADPSKTVDGFIAHEVQAVVPEAVTGTKDAVDNDGNPVYQGIDQSKLVPLLTAALQEAVERIEKVEVEKAEQQTVLDDLLARVAALETA